MANAFDRFAKEFIEEVLAPIAAVKPEHQVETPAQNIDVVVEPNAEVDRAKAFGEFGWLARRIEGPCLLEPYSRTPGVSDLRKCLQRQLAWDSHSIQTSSVGLEFRRHGAISVALFVWPGEEGPGFCKLS